jgi:hypothetical protein
MSEKESLNLRIEQGLKDEVSKISEDVEGDSRPSDLSTTAQKLILVGIGAERAGVQEKVVGPLEILPRPFATAEFGGEKTSMGTQLTAEQLDELQTVFEAKKHTAAREALRLGVVMIQAGSLDIEGPLSIFRPFAKMKIDEEVEGELAQEALEAITEARDDEA